MKRSVESARSERTTHPLHTYSSSIRHSAWSSCAVGARTRIWLLIGSSAASRLLINEISMSKSVSNCAWSSDHPSSVQSNSDFRTNSDMKLEAHKPVHEDDAQPGIDVDTTVQLGELSTDLQRVIVREQRRKMAE